VSKSVYDAAFAALENGISVIPIRADGSKAPSLAQWTGFQQTKPTEQQLEAWFDPPTPVGVAVICGAVSGNLECLEFERYEEYCAFRRLAAQSGCDTLISRLDHGYCERSPRGGVHWIYRNDNITGGKKLASRLRPDGTVEVLIETRGEGNYIIVAPSGGAVHATGRSYELMAGGFDSIPVLSDDERNTLFALARRFDEMPKRDIVDHAPTSGHRAGHRPGDAWAKLTSWKEILEPHGWAYVRTDKDITYWRRPGKDRGISGATGWSESDTLKVYSTSTVFDADTTYSKFAAYCLLEHDSDWSAGTKALVALGFGEQADEGTVIIPPPPGMGAKELQLPNDPLDYPFTDSGNAELFVDAYGDEWCYNYRRKKWMRWHGHWWRPDDTRVVEERALATARLRYHAADNCEDEEYAEKARKFARQSENDARIKSMLNRAQTMPDVKDPGLGWDTAPFLLGVENGVVDLLTGELRDGRREDHITQHVPIVYDPKAECPRFQRFIAEIMGHDPALQEFLWLALAYSLTADVREQCLFMCYGRGSNGKTTLLNLMQRLLGDDPASGYARTISGKALQQQHGGGSSSQNDTLSVIVGKRLVTSAELPVRAIDADRLKALAGGDVINTRFLFGEPFDFRPVAKFWLSFNAPPHVGDDSHGFWRKVLLIPFTCCFDPAAEPDLEAKLYAELPGILAWLVSGVAVWKEHGLKTPASVIAATEDYREDADMLAVFFADCLVRVEGGKMRASETYRIYKTWAMDQGLSLKETLTSTAFGRRMSERYEKKRTSIGNVYLGIDLRSNQPAEDPF